MINSDDQTRSRPERRRHRRVTLTSPVVARVAGQELTIIDVSEGGVLLQSPLPYEGIFSLTVEQPPFTAWVRVVQMVRATSGTQAMFLIHAAFMSALDENQHAIVRGWMESAAPL